MITVNRWLAPPIFEHDAEKTRLAAMFNATLLIIQAFTFLLVLSAFFGGQMPGGNIIIATALFLGSLALRRLLFMGQIIQTGALLCTVGTLAITIAIANVGSVYSASTALYLFPIIIAGIIFGVKGILVTTTVSSLAVAGLILAGEAGLLPPPSYHVTLSQWLTYTFIFGLISYLSYFTYHSTAQAIQRAKEEIEERKQIENALRESDERWQFALEGAGDGVWDWNAQTNAVYFSRVWKTMLGYEPEEIGSSLSEWDERIHPADRQATYDILNRHLAGETEIYISEHRVRCKDGSYKWILDRGKVISRSPTGEPLRVMGTHTDITERKEFEEALRLSEARYRALFEQTHDAVFILDFHVDQLEANHRAAEMLGYTPAEIKALSLQDFTTSIGESPKIIEALLAGEHLPTYEGLMRKKDGRLIPVEINLELIKDSLGSPRHIQSVIRDISRRKAAEAALKTINGELSQKVNEIEQLHEELRQQALHDPLTGLYNRRYLNEMLGREIIRARRDNHPLSIIVSDIDHFKRINDTYGHPVGDRFLIEIAHILKRQSRGSDLACRYGGDEFLLVFPQATLAAAALRAEEIRQKCTGIAIHTQGQVLSITLSFGIACYPNHGEDAEEVIHNADRALYFSKNCGRNRVSTFDDLL